jgi:flavin-dependent dehydrogenase
LTSQCERIGIQIEYGSTVVAYDEIDAMAIVTIERAGNMTRAEADIVVAADGVGTKSHSHVSGRSIKATSSGYSLFRGLIPIGVIKKELDPGTFQKFFTGERPEFRIYIWSVSSTMS